MFYDLCELWLMQLLLLLWLMFRCMKCFGLGLMFRVWLKLKVIFELLQLLQCIWFFMKLLQWLVSLLMQFSELLMVLVLLRKEDGLLISLMWLMIQLFSGCMVLLYCIGMLLNNWLIWFELKLWQVMKLLKLGGVEVFMLGRLLVMFWVLCRLCCLKLVWLVMFIELGVLCRFRFRCELLLVLLLRLRVGGVFLLVLVLMVRVGSLVGFLLVQSKVGMLVRVRLRFSVRMWWVVECFFIE